MTTGLKHVLVCGGREYNDYARVHHYLQKVLLNNPLGSWCVLEGGCPGGADRAARQWAMIHGVEGVTVAADWNAHGKAAGPIRNQKMLDDYKPVLVLAFPGGSGTADMVRRAKKAGVRVVECT